MHGNAIKWMPALWLCLALAAGAVEIRRPVETDIDFVRLKMISYDEVREIVSPFLSPDGKLGYARGRHLLVIHDYRENIERIKAIIAEIDETPANIRVEVRFDETGRREDFEAGVDLNDVVIVHRDGDTDVHGRVTGRLGAGTYERSSFTSQFIMAGDGRPARIWVGDRVSDPVFIYNYGIRHGWWETGFVTRELGASLWVLPRLLPDGLVEIEVYPRLTSRSQQGIGVDVKEVSTKIIAANGQTVQIGGLDTERQNVYRRLFGISKVFDGNSLTISLTPHVFLPPKAPPEAPAPAGPNPGY